MSGHYRIVCRDCAAVIAQCRCPATEKSVRLERCADCARRATPAVDPNDLAAYLIEERGYRSPEQVQAQIEAARAEEREACAKVADHYVITALTHRHADIRDLDSARIAERIRARSGARGV